MTIQQIVITGLDRTIETAEEINQLLSNAN